MPAFRLPFDLSDVRAALRWTDPAGLFKTACCFGLLWLSLSGLSAHAAQQVSLLLSEPEGIYREVAQAIERELARDPDKWNVRIHNMDAAQKTTGVVVALGVRALQYALSRQDNAPLLAVLVPAQAFTNLTSQSTGSIHRQISALYLDQPISRQLRLIRIAMPQARRIGILVSPGTEERSIDLRKAGQLAGMDIDVRTVRNQEQLFSSLDDLSGNVDTLLLLPDPTIVNGDILKILFVKAYRQGLPIVAYSPGLVQAGALLGLHATPAQLGAEAGKWLREMPLDKGVRLAAPRYPKSFTVDVNRSVARSLEFKIPSSQVLEQELGGESGR